MNGETNTTKAVSATVERAKILEATYEAAPILVAVDFSPDSEAALLWACAYAERIDAAIVVLHVVHDPAEAPGKYKPEDGNPLEPMMEVAERQLSEFLAGVKVRHPEMSGLETAKLICVAGLPSGTIVDLAQRHGAQHLVLGSRGRNGLARVLLGSTSDKVVRRAPLPVTIVKATR